ncbi:MAG: ABC transporter permease [Cyclobacteriaceae bacterium]|nr:ABC transporter permease [Cyclobacteriaceae bacterium]
MFKNNLKIAFRSLFKQKLYTTINILGLAVGVASCLLIVLFVRNEYSYDKFFKDGDRIYRMVLERKYPNHSTFYAIIPHSFAGVALRDFPEIESVANLFGFGDFPMSYRNERDEIKQFDEDFMLIADSTFLKMFSFDLLKGNPDLVLRQANELVITEEMALRYFGAEDPIGKIMRSGDQEYKVSGVLQDIPDNSHFKFNAILSTATFPFSKRENFTSFSAYTFFKLKPNTDAASLEAKFPKMVDTYAAAQIERDLGKSWADYRNEGNGYRYFLQPLTGIHLDPTNLEVQMKPSGNRTSVLILIGVAILILIIACINFMNLATARSSERAKEVGVRKTMGSFRQQLIGQFLTESFVLSAVGMLLAVLMVYFLLPYFNDLTGKQLVLPITMISIVSLLGLAAIVGLLAGIYPSFVLSGFNPVVVMKGNFTGSSKGKWIRNGLVVFQFWISIMLMIGTLVIQQQMAFMQSKSLGFDKDQLLIVEKVFTMESQKQKTFLEEIRRMPQIAKAAGSSAIPGKENDYFGIQFQPEGSSEILTTKSMVIADGLEETLGFTLKEGRFFSEETTDSTSIILNESAVKVMGLENPIGRKLINVRQDNNGNRIEAMYTITGIVNDFNFISLKEEITPLVLMSSEGFGNGNAYVMARVKGGQIPEAIQSVETLWKEVNPEQSFKFSFLDENINAQYEAEQKSGSLFALFSGLAIFVSCIGLFALSAYITSLRTKEIGVRKVLGSSVAEVVILLSKDFTKMILLAFVMAVPLAWYIMETWWLQNFAYRINVSLWIIFVSGAAALLIAWITVSYQSIKAAVQNPVGSLRSE